MADRNGFMRKNNKTKRRSMEDEEFEEEEIWSISNIEEETQSPSPNTSKSKNHNSFTSSSKGKFVKQSSSPINIPDWSKIYGKNANMNDDGNGDGDGDDDDGSDDMVPPHEWLARKLERSQISSFSVCEGVGRTLKGKDLSKVRNAILTRTGFLE